RLGLGALPWRSWDGGDDGCMRRPGDAVAHGESPLRTLAGSELDHLTCPAAGRRSEGTDGRVDPEDDEVVVEEDNIDREAHERGVDRPCRPQRDAFAGWQRAPSEQAAHAPEGLVGDRDLLADDAAVLTTERQRSSLCHPSAPSGSEPA